MKKTLKKELETILVKAINEVLLKHDAPAAKKIKKNIKDAGKTISKKFVKALEVKKVIVEKPKPVAVVVTKTPRKRAVKSASPVDKKKTV